MPFADSLTTTLAALADPTRRAILARLSQGEATVNELAAPFNISLPAISRHLKVLVSARLIARGREAQWRPCRLTAGPLQEAADWLEEYRGYWEESFDRLDDYLRELRSQKNSHHERNGGGMATPGNAVAEESPERVLIIDRICAAPRESLQTLEPTNSFKGE